MSKNIFGTVFGVAWFLLIGCGSPKSSTGESVSNSAAEVQTAETVAAWTSIYFDWASGENSPENACAEGRVTLNSDRTLQVRDCSETRSAKISNSEMELLQRKLEPVLSSLDHQITCNGDAIADYEQDWKLVDGSGQTIKVYQFNIKDTCGRVSDVNDLNDYLYELREKYFPRAEEGEYQD